MPGVEDSPRRVELFVRSLAPDGVAGPTRRHLQRLRCLESRGAVTDLRVDVWGREVALSSATVGTRAGRHVLSKVAAFREWSDRRGVSLEPFFETRRVRGDLVTGERVSLRLPVACLAEYENDELVHVSPYVTGNAICTVSDRIGRLEARSVDPAAIGRVDADGRDAPDRPSPGTGDPPRPTTR